MRYRFQDRKPKLGHGVYVAPSADVIGDVELGDQASVWFGSVLRGDVGPIRVGRRTNIQDLCVLHVTEGARGTFLGEDVVVGHRALVHECRVENLALIGMGCVLLDGCVIGEGAIVAAGAVVREAQEIPARALVAGVPGEIRKILPAESLAARRAHAAHYVELAAAYLEGECLRLD